MGSTRRRAAMAGGALALVVLVGTAGPARSDTTFSGLAAADGVRVTISDPSVVPTGAELGLSGPSAQALVDSLGNSQAYAALPYPGDLGVAVPGTLRGQGASGVPDYPLYAASNRQGQPSADVATPSGYALHATSDPTSSKASAAGGATGDPAQAGATTATATVTTAEGTVRAVSESTTEAFEIAGVLRIGRVHSRAQATGDGKATSELQVGDVTVAGQAVALTDQGITTPGGTTPLPDTGAVAAVLQQAGIAVRYLAPERAKDGITSAGVEVRVTHDDANGTLTTVYTVGRAAAFAGGTPVGATTVAELEATGPVDDTAALGAAAVVAPTNDTPVAAVPVALPVTRSRAGVAAPASYRVAPVSSFSTTGVYLLLLLAAVTCFGGVQLIRYLGVKLAWK